jgi:DNA polymerase I-like protein with 3'-5' exonuclease and polymerase domains
MAFVVDDEALNTRSEASTRFFDAIDHVLESNDQTETPWVAFDCEGINLCRAGTVELVSLYFPESAKQEGATFLVDLGKSKSAFRSARVSALKKLFESNNVAKVIHDSRMDSDALFHLENIKLIKVHDTSCFHTELTGCADLNLNDLLSYYGMDKNGERDKSVYKRNPAFWATRPLTSTMIEWASSDVDKLILVALKQVAGLKERGGSKLLQANEKSMHYTCLVRDMQLERNISCLVPIGRFIGPRGSNIRNVQKSTGTMIYQEHQSGRKTKWLIFYSDSSSLAQAKGRMGY